MADSNITRNADGSGDESSDERKSFQDQHFRYMRSMRYESQQFYYHFKDKYDLINWIFYTEFVEQYPSEEYKDALQLLEDICDYLYQERDFYRVALKIGRTEFFPGIFSEVGWIHI